MTTVYLLHFDPPFKHARHYIGVTHRDDVQDRLAEHLAGRGARLVKHAVAAGCAIVLARTWPGVERRYELTLKKQGGASRCCPICKEANS